MLSCTNKDTICCKYCETTIAKGATINQCELIMMLQVHSIQVNIHILVAYRLVNSTGDGCESVSKPLLFLLQAEDK